MFESKSNEGNVESGMKTEREQAVIIFKSALDSFLEYARNNEDYIVNGRDEGNGRISKGRDFLFSGPYASRSQTTPSERGFCGDKRLVTGQMNESQMNERRTLADVVDKDDVLKGVKDVMPDVSSKVSNLLKEYDGWKDVYEKGKFEFDFDATASFLEMSKRVCEGLESIKANS